MKAQTIDIKPDELVDVQQVGGDLSVESWERGQVEAHGEPIRVEHRPGEVRISCGGDLALKIPKGAGLSISSIGGSLRVQDLAGPVELRMVGGDASLRNLTGSVRLVGVVAGEMHMENVKDISFSPGKGIDPMGITDRVRRKVEQAARRAETKVRRAEFRGFHHSMGFHRADFSGWNSEARGNTSAPESAGEAVSDEERMTILKMLQEKKITSEQAEQLLSALEGKA